MLFEINWKNTLTEEFSGGPMVKNMPSNAGDMGSIPDLGRFHMLPDNKACVP